MADWTRQPQEQDGNYFFAGRMYMTRRIAAELPPEEIHAIVRDLQTFVADSGGVDYLQVYVSEDDRKIFCIDQLSRPMIEGDSYSEKQIAAYDYWTMLFAEEY
jgi:hypothetical protein